MQQLTSTAGIGNAVFAAQSVFRKVMDATARPGSVHSVTTAVAAPAPLMPASAAIALTLFDHDTPVWLDAGLKIDAVMSWLRFQTACPIVADPAQSAFALVSDAATVPSFESFALGTPDYPDRSTTLILQLSTLTEGPALSLSGPGIRSSATLRAGSLPDDFDARLAGNRVLFPLGVDLLLVATDQLAALPRTTVVART